MLTSFRNAFLIAVAVLLTAPVYAENARIIDPIPQSILFCGSSLTWGGGGLHTHFENLDKASDNPLNFNISTRLKGGADIGELWAEGLMQPMIRDNDYDVVVLQQMPVRMRDASLPASRYDYAFACADTVINFIRDSSNSTPVWYMTWNWQNLTQEGIPEAIEDIESVYDIPLLPVYAVFEEVRAERPDSFLYADDVHPTEAGAYLGSCVFYIAFTHKSPVGNSYYPSGVSASDAAYLQQAAWDYMKGYVNPVDDETAPVISSVTAESATQVIITFSEDVDSATAVAVGNYAVDNGVSVSAAAVDGATVTLTTSTLNDVTAYTLTVSNVEDLSENVITAASSMEFTYTPKTLQDGVVAYWSMNNATGGTIADGAGDNDATVVSGTWDSGGKFGGCMVFAGGDGMTAGTGKLNMDVTGAYTVAAWVNLASGGGVLAQRGDYIHPFSLKMSSMRPQVIARADNNTTYLNAPSNISADIWQHLAVTCADDGILSLYINGVLAESTRVTGTLDVTTGREILLGKGLNGKLDEVYIFDRALDIGELTSLMAGGTSAVTMPFSRSSGPVTTGMKMYRMTGEEIPAGVVPAAGVYMLYDGKTLTKKVIIR